MNIRILALAAAALGAVPAQATTLVAGSNTLGGTTVAAEPNLAGTVQEDSLDDFTITGNSGTLTATVQSRVVLSVDGTYDFYWRIRDITFAPSGAGGDPLTIGALRIGEFGTSVLGYNANFRTDGLGDRGPGNAFVFPDTSYVNFAFDAGLAAGEESYFIFLDTDARTYSRRALLDLATPAYNPISGLGTTFGPGRVPEPATWALMILGFGGVAGAMRRRRATPSVAFA